MTINKEMHGINGNSQIKKNKVLKIMQTNTGNGDFGSSQNLLKIYMDQHRPDFMVVSEANLKGDETNLNIDFPNYTFEVNLMKNMKKSRLIVLIKKGIEYKRIKNYEEDDLSSIWICVKINKSKYLYILRAYRQRNVPDEVGIINSGKPEVMLECLKRLIAQLTPICNQGQLALIPGDINIELLINNSQEVKDKKYN